VVPQRRSARSASRCSKAPQWSSRGRRRTRCWSWRRAQGHGLAIRRFDEDPAAPGRFTWGFISSSDNHRARPGTGYKAVDRRQNTESSGPVDQSTRELMLGKAKEKVERSVLIPQEQLMRMTKTKY
jgi:hypothetical protein